MAKCKKAVTLKYVTCLSAVLALVGAGVLSAAARVGGTRDHADDTLSARPPAMKTSAASGDDVTVREPSRDEQTDLTQVESPIRMLYVPLSLRKDTRGRDRGIVEALSKIDWFTHVILVAPSWQEAPGAGQHPFVKQAVANCAEQGVDVVWGRWLWVAWPPDERRAAHPESHFDPAYYAAAIRAVKDEARRLGAAGTFLDTEPYGVSPQKQSLKSADLDGDVRSRVANAVRTAVAETGLVDLIYPASSGRPTHYAWPLVHLGKLRCDSKTYYTRPPAYKWPRVRAPKGYDHRVDLWGCNVGLGREGDTIGGLQKPTIEEVKSLDMDRIRGRYPECRGIWVYADIDILARVIVTWSE